MKYTPFRGSYLPMAALAAMGFFSVASLPAAENIAATQSQAAATSDNDPHASVPGAHGGADPHQFLNPEQHLRVAIQHFQEGRVELTLDTLNTALDSYPDNLELLGSRAGIQLQLGRVAEALKNLEYAVSLAPDNAQLLVKRAEAYRRFQRQEEAYADLDHAIEIEPDNLPARFNRGSLLLAEGKAADSIIDFDQCIALDPHLPAPWFNRAAAYHAIGNKTSAIEDMKRFLKISTNAEWNKTAEDLLAEWGAVQIPETAKTNSDS